MHKLFLVIIFSFGCIIVAHSQDKRFEYTDSSLLSEPDQTTENNNSEIVQDEVKDILSDTTVYINKINISPDSIISWKNDKRFAYVSNLDSLLKIKQQEEMAAYNDSLKNKSKPDNFFEKLFASGIPQLIFWAVAIAFVGFILYKLFLNNGVFSKGTKAIEIKSKEQEEDVLATVSDYDKLIHQSYKLGDFRMAVRYLFLKNLSQLADKEYLHYSADKTNYQYVQEIRADRKNEFSSLVLNYEYIWYGNFPLTSDTYAGIEKKFSSFYNKIQ